MKCDCWLLAFCQAFGSVRAVNFGCSSNLLSPCNQPTTSTMASPEFRPIHAHTLFVRHLRHPGWQALWLVAGPVFLTKRSRMKISILSLFLLDFFLTVAQSCGIRQITAQGAQFRLVFKWSKPRTRAARTASAVPTINCFLLKSQESGHSVAWLSCFQLGCQILCSFC